MPTIAIVTFEGFNEIDSFVALNLLNRVDRPGWRAILVSPAPEVTSMNGARVAAHAALEAAEDADAVLIGSGRGTRAVVADAATMQRLRLDPRRQIIGSQCSGALVLAKLGLLGGAPASTVAATRPVLETAGVTVLERPLVARGNVATAGGCLSSVYLATWTITRLAGEHVAREALAYVAPVGEERTAIEHAIAVACSGVGGTQQGITDDELWTGFRAPSLPAGDWNHRAHIRVAWLHLDRFAFDEAHLRFRAAILRLNASHGVEESPVRGYHETLTRAWLFAVAGARADDARAGRPAPDSAAFCTAHPELLERDFLLSFYSRERLFSAEARAVFLPPDRARLPGHGDGSGA
jgi:putative intracellular protease/amidase